MSVLVYVASAHTSAAALKAHQRLTGFQRECQMTRKFLGRITVSLVISAAAMLPISQSAFAEAGTGRVSTYHLNSDVVARGACVRTTPDLPSPGGWACVWPNNLYRELNETLREAYIAGKICTIAWNVNDYQGLAQITWIDCH